jgi:hypothetical protein
MTTNTEITALDITPAQIRALRAEAVAAGDRAMVRICDDAYGAASLKARRNAKREIAAVLREAAARA